MTPRLHGLDVLRVWASVLVVLGHILAWFSIRGHSSWLVGTTAATVTGPIHLNTNLGFVGVGLFLLISGIVVTHVTDREAPGEFLFRRLTRLLPLLWVVTLMAWLAINAGLQVSASAEGPLDFGDLLRGLVLANHLEYPSTALVGVTWILLHQIAFYVLVAASIPVLRRRAWLVPTGVAALCWCLLLVSAASRSMSLSTTAAWTLHTVGQFATYIPLLCIGQVISLVHSGKIGKLPGFAIGSALYLVFLYSDRIGGYTFQGDAMPRTVLLLILLVLLMMRVSGPISRSAFIKGWARRTYAIYLVHLGCIFTAMDLLVGVVGPELAILAAIGLTFLVSEVLHQAVERPVDRWLRSRRRVPRAGSVAA